MVTPFRDNGLESIDGGVVEFRVNWSLVTTRLDESSKRVQFSLITHGGIGLHPRAALSVIQ